MPAIPSTTVQKMIGAISIRISRMNTSPSGFSATPTSGAKCPINAPMTIAIRTWTYRRRR